MPELIRDTSTTAFNFDLYAKLVFSAVVGALPNAKSRQSINERTKPRFAGKSAGSGPFSSYLKNISRCFSKCYNLCREVAVALRATGSVAISHRISARHP
jgi:hypothetical protein